MKKSSKNISDSEKENKALENQDNTLNENPDSKSFIEGILREKQKDLNQEKDIEKRLIEAEIQKEEAEDRLLRTLAEFENYKKRVSREKEDLIKYANQNFAKEILPVIDNFERALEQVKNAKNAEVVNEGLEMILKQLFAVLDKFDIKPFESLGLKFNPEHHEAMARQEVEDYDDNTIIEEYEKGYFIGDKLLRPSRVVVAKKKDISPEN